jgi:hypothetical protein
MRRGAKSRLMRLALAYLLAMQALLGAWAGHAAAANSRSLDSSLSLCRTLAAGEMPQSVDDGAPRPHCAAMCLTGACAAGDPPAAVRVAFEFSPPRIAYVSTSDVRDTFPSAAPGRGLNARGPPSIG